MPLKLATYNIHRCVGRDGISAPARIARVVGDIDADVTALQEVAISAGGTANPLARLAQAAGAHAIAGPTLLDRQGHYGNALLTRMAPLSVERLDISLPGREPRGAMAVTLPIKGQRVRILVTHLGLRPTERRYQMRRLLSLLDDTGTTLTVLLGDFNEWFTRGRALKCINRRFGHRAAPATFPSHRPLLALDRIWVHPPHRLISLKVHIEPPATIASDHLPLVADVAL
jgi:endonuclease/exonuclease/phosphatase family metal-dependent hydrolase